MPTLVAATGLQIGHFPPGAAPRRAPRMSCGNQYGISFQYGIFVLY